MATFMVIISGIAPLLQHRFSEEAEIGASVRAVHVKTLDPRAAAENAAYRTEAGELYFPGMAIARLLREAGSSHKQRGSRRSLRYIIPGTVIVIDDQIILRDADGRPLTHIEVDSRPVVIPATKGRIMRHRARLNAWHAEFSLEIEDEAIAAETIHQLLTEGGRRLGIGDFRPEKGGPFGRFIVTEWQELAQQAPRLAA